MTDPIRVRIKDDEIWFNGWGDDLSAFLRKVESALAVKAKKRRMLIFVVRYDFAVDGESVLLAVDEDGTAYIGLGKNSASVKQKVIDRIKQSSDFQEV
jgi:hypothetical protein